MNRWNEMRPRWWQRSVARVALAALTGGLVGANAGAITHGAYLFFVEPCAWHAAMITGLGSSDGAGAYADVRYQRGGTQDSADIDPAFLVRARVGERVWVQQCQQGFGQVDDDALDTIPHQEGADVPQRSTD